jgi:hypothetical protein
LSHKKSIPVKIPEEYCVLTQFPTEDMISIYEIFSRKVIVIKMEKYLKLSGFMAIQVWEKLNLQKTV